MDIRNTSDPLRVLLVEDEPTDALTVAAVLERRGRFRVTHVEAGADALEELARASFDVVLSDVMLPEIDGIALIARLREIDPAVPVVLYTASGTLERAVAGLKAGAADFLVKPVEPQALEARLERAARERGIRHEWERVARRELPSDPAALLGGDHPRIEEIREIVRRVAASPTTRLLVTGESGTGKSLLARIVHGLSGVGGAFVEVNCAALPEGLLESELFGHEKGAFTDARTTRKGLVETAHHGTLFLDEIGALPVGLQAKLLTYLERREIRRVGGTHMIPVETRVVAATNEDLKAAVRAGRFREDLLYRLDVVAARMPALREIPTVIPEIARRLVSDLSAELNRPVPVIDEASLLALTTYGWPGNVRELRNVLERGLIFHEGGAPFRAPLPPAEVGRPQGVALGTPAGVALGPEPTAEADGAGAGTDGALRLPLGLPLEDVERRYVSATLAARPDADQDEVAASLGISRKTLWARRRRWGLPTRGTRGGPMESEGRSSTLEG